MGDITVNYDLEGLTGLQGKRGSKGNWRRVHVRTALPCLLPQSAGPPRRGGRALLLEL